MMIFILGWICIFASIYTQCASAYDADFISTDYDAYNSGQLGHRPHLDYKSSQQFSPLLQVNVWNESAIDNRGSHIFMRHDGNSSSPLSTPLILDAKDLSAVYMNRSFENVFGTRVQENLGKRYLTFWEGKKGDGIGNGYGLAYDDNYNLIYNITAYGIAAHADLHEFAFSGNGTALVTGVDNVMANTEGWEGWRGNSKYPVLDAIFQEIDLETNKMIFSWRALDHINPMDSFEPVGWNWDIYHMNSIQKTKAGNYLISMRHTHSIHLIDGKTGNIIWTLGGKRNDFVEIDPAEGTNPLSPLLTMSWQHHARFLPNTGETEMTFFDNHGKTTTQGVCNADCSRGLHIAIEDRQSPPTVQLLREYLHPSRLRAQSQGNLQALSIVDGHIGNVFIGWGRCPSFTEHTPSGETVMDVQFSPWHSSAISDALDNYRAYKLDWSATPWWDPEIFLQRVSEAKLDIYVSWNGATEVSEWIVRGVRSKVLDGKNGDVLARSPRRGFETKLTVEQMDVHYIWSEALDKDGIILGSTAIWALEAENMTIVIDSKKTSTLDPEEGDETLLNSWILLASGTFVFVVTCTVGIILWRWRKDYKRLEGYDSDLETETDVVSLLGLEGLHSLEHGHAGGSRISEERNPKVCLPM